MSRLFHNEYVSQYSSCENKLQLTKYTTLYLRDLTNVS